jgi:tRNA threonylcarbamoyladenosine biosynthesis protein TsaE
LLLRKPKGRFKNLTMIAAPSINPAVTTENRLTRRHVGLDEIAALAAVLARAAQPGDVITLSGGLGAGKTTFARFFIQALAVNTGGDAQEEVPSPTFTLVQVYERDPAPVWHFDLYRITRAEDAYELNIEEAFEVGISLIEWSERLGALLPSDRLDVHLETEPGDEEAASTRALTLSAYGAWASRLGDICKDV